MFDFVVKYLGVLKHVPILAMLFDALQFLYCAVFHKEIIDCIESIEFEVATWEGVSVSAHKYGGTEFSCNGKEIGHIHGNGLVDILFSTKIKTELITAGKAKEHHIFKKSGWISYDIQSEQDKENALALLNQAYQLILKHQRDDT